MLTFQGPMGMGFVRAILYFFYQEYLWEKIQIVSVGMNRMRKNMLKNH